MDQLSFHHAAQDIMSYFNTLLEVLVKDSGSIRRCIVKQPNENSDDIKKYRNMVYETWKRLLMKSKALMKSIIRSNTPTDNSQVLRLLANKLDSEIELTN